MKDFKVSDETLSAGKLSWHYTIYGAYATQQSSKISLKRFQVIDGSVTLNLIKENN